jgi:DNA-binding transcriptional ArsR family regulator
MDGGFKALADPSRRSLLDSLFQHDGQTLGQLCTTLASEMGRFGVMKHLRVLEESGLVVKQRRGREKRHYLNPVPIQQIHDRWINKYRIGFASALAGLKEELESKEDRQ